MRRYFDFWTDDVRSVGVQEVLKQSAYMLFYRRREATMRLFGVIETSNPPAQPQHQQHHQQQLPQPPQPPTTRPTIDTNVYVKIEKLKFSKLCTILVVIIVKIIFIRSILF